MVGGSGATANWQIANPTTGALFPRRISQVSEKQTVRHAFNGDAAISSDAAQQAVVYKTLSQSGDGYYRHRLFCKRLTPWWVWWHSCRPSARREELKKRLGEFRNRSTVVRWMRWKKTCFRRGEKLDFRTITGDRTPRSRHSLSSVAPLVVGRAWARCVDGGIPSAQCVPEHLPRDANVETDRRMVSSCACPHGRLAGIFWRIIITLCQKLVQVSGHRWVAEGTSGTNGCWRR